MKYIIGAFLFFLFLFVVYAILVIVKSDEGVFDTCVYDFEKCVLVDNADTVKPIRILKCSDKVFFCNLRSLYYSFFDEKRLDDEYNEYFMNILAKEIERDELLKKKNAADDDVGKDNTFPSDSKKEKKDADESASGNVTKGESSLLPAVNVD